MMRRTWPCPWPHSPKDPIRQCCGRAATGRTCDHDVFDWSRQVRFASRPIAGAAFGQRVQSRIILSIAPMIKTVQPACKVKLAWVRPKLAARNTSRGNALVDAIDADAHFIPRRIRRESAHPPPFHRYRDGAGAGRFTRGAPARRLRRPRASRVDAPSVASAWAGSDGRPSGTCCRPTFALEATFAAGSLMMLGSDGAPAAQRG
jgi:hypothetical protein